MAEEQQNTPQAEGNSESNPSTQADKNDVPYTRFQEVVGQKNQFKSQIEELQTELQKVNAQQEEQRQETLKKNSEFETLYNETNSELAKYKEQNKALTTDLGAFRQGLVEQLPEGRRVYTEGMNMATLQKFVQDEQVAVNANKADSSRAGTTAKGEFGGYGSIEEWASKDPVSCEQHLNKNVTGFSWGNINKK
jgi:DNA-binding protein H-NS